MLIALSEECPIFAEGHVAHLHRFLGSVVQYRHALVAPPPSRLQAMLPQASWQVYGEFVTREFTRAANLRYTPVFHDDCGSCTPNALSEFYALPAVLIVENASTDGDWLKLVIERLRPHMRRLVHGAGPALDIRQAGGVGEIPKELERHATARSSIKPAGQVPLRVLALCDSDATRPQSVSDAAKRVEATAARLGAVAHILIKRTIENYIPFNALHSFAETRAHVKPAVALLGTLSNVQYDYYPMKDGLREHDVSSSDALYSPTTQLAVGFGDFIADFLANFRHHVETHELRARDGRAELESLLDLIEENT